MNLIFVEVDVNVEQDNPWKGKASLTATIQGSHSNPKASFF